MSENTTELQRQVTHAALDALHEHPFALAGSGAIREHGFIQRLSHDVDLFSNDPTSFGAAVDALDAELTARGFTVDQIRRYESFAQLRVTTADGQAVDMDLAVDWRSTDPVSLQVGPVLAVEDAVGSKVGAIYTRLEARDFIDVDAIRQSGRFTDEHLLQMAETRDDGFDRATYATQLRQVARIRDGRFADYGTTGDDLTALRTRILRWADSIAPRPADQRTPATTVSPSRRASPKRPWPTDGAQPAAASPRRDVPGPEVS